MGLDRLSKYKGVQDKKPLIDRMDKTELAAHLFRLTQTELKIKTDNIRGQQNLQDAAREVGAKVRKTVIDINGIAPEDLAVTTPIGEVKKALKGTTKKLASLDGKKKASKPQPPSVPSNSETCTENPIPINASTSMRFRYLHEERFESGEMQKSNIMWDMEGKWPMQKGAFPPEHPSVRFADQVKAFMERGYWVSPFPEGDGFTMDLKLGQSRDKVVQDIIECFGWTHS